MSPTNARASGHHDLGSIPLNTPMPEEEFRRRLADAAGIAETDGAALRAVLHGLVASGTVETRRAGAERYCTLVRRYGPVRYRPPTFHSPEDDHEEPGGDRALQRARQRDRAAEERRVRRIVREELRSLGVTP